MKRLYVDWPLSSSTTLSASTSTGSSLRSFFISSKLWKGFLSLASRIALRVFLPTPLRSSIAWSLMLMGAALLKNSTNSFSRDLTMILTSSIIALRNTYVRP